MYIVFPVFGGSSLMHLSISWLGTEESGNRRIETGVYPVLSSGTLLGVRISRIKKLLNIIFLG
jgi:hypothetical protein